MSHSTVVSGVSLLGVAANRWPCCTGLAFSLLAKIRSVASVTLESLGAAKPLPPHEPRPIGPLVEGSPGL